MSGHEARPRRAAAALSLPLCPGSLCPGSPNSHRPPPPEGGRGEAGQGRSERLRASQGATSLPPPTPHEARGKEPQCPAPGPPPSTLVHGVTKTPHLPLSFLS